MALDGCFGVIRNTSFLFHTTLVSEASLQKERINVHKGEKWVKERRKMSGNFQIGFLSEFWSSHSEEFLKVKFN